MVCMQNDALIGSLAVLSYGRQVLAGKFLSWFEDKQTRSYIQMGFAKVDNN